VSSYRDFREYVAALDEAGLLRRVTSSICKDTELMPLVRLQFRGLPAEQRTAFLFEDVTDVEGRRYPGPVAVGVMGANRDVYAKALGCAPDDIVERWAEIHDGGYIDPVLVDDGPVLDEIHVGDDLLEHDGILEFPHPISTPGFDPAPYFTSPFWVTKDPETGVRNVGTYRVMVKGPGHAGMMAHQSQHIGLHLQSARRRGEMLEAAIILGCAPAIGLCSVAKIPYGVDELAVAGAIAGEPVELVKCRTVDLEVPATAEIVIEGYVDPTFREAEAPFGEYTGYMGTRVANPVFFVTGILHRRAPVYQAFLSQFPPSESSLIRKLAYDAVYLKHLRSSNIPGVLDVQLHEATGSYGLMVIQLKKVHPSQPWQALHSAAALDPTIGKMIVAVDDDIDPNDADAVNWALAFRMRPHLDVHILTGKASILDPSSAPPEAHVDEQRFPPPVGTSCILIDATRKWDYPPTSLPRKEFMDRALRRWEEEGLPPLSLKKPWFGYELGYWTDEARDEAQAAVEGGYLGTGARLESLRETVPPSGFTDTDDSETRRGELDG
jgi:UbiD family decarboxylase